MTAEKSKSKPIHIILWIAQIVLAAGLMYGGITKLFQPLDQLSTMWPWAGQVDPKLVRFTGAVDLLGMLGLTLPGIFRIKQWLIPIAALGVIMLMTAAIIFHIERGEQSEIGVNIIFALIAACIARGRWKKVAE